MLRNSFWAKYLQASSYCFLPKQVVQEGGTQESVFIPNNNNNNNKKPHTKNASHSTVSMYKYNPITHLQHQLQK